MISYDEALSRIAEKTISNGRDISQGKKQRRTGFVDLFGVETPKTLSSTSAKGRYYISVSPDLEYFERFQFKVAVENTSSVGSVTITIKRAGDPDSSAIDLTPYLMEQHGSWITGDGIYPSEDFGEESEWKDFYDILDACGLLIANNQEDEVNTKILDPGLHVITISGISADVSLILYMKYSHINR